MIDIPVGLIDLIVDTPMSGHTDKLVVIVVTGLTHKNTDMER